MEAFAMGQRFFTALALARGESPAAQTGPLVPGLLRAHGIQPVSVQLFPVTVSHLGTAGTAAVGLAPGGSHGGDGQSAGRVAAPPGIRLPEGDRAVRRAMPPPPATSFVEIQNTMLFATVGQRADA